MTSLLVPDLVSKILRGNKPPGSKGLRFGEIVGLNAGDELEDLLWPRVVCLKGRRRLFEECIVGVAPPPFGSKDAGMEMKDGLPIEGPALIGPKVGVEPADLTV